MARSRRLTRGTPARRQDGVVELLGAIEVARRDDADDLEVSAPDEVVSLITARSPAREFHRAARSAPLRGSTM